MGTVDIKQLRSFLTVANAHSFSRAADILNFSPSAVFKQISSLENEYGVKFFTRKNHVLELTDEGQIMLFRATRIMDEIHGIRQDLISGDNLPNTVSLGYLTVSGTRGARILLSSAFRSFPNLSVVRTIADGPKMARMMADGLLDFSTMNIIGKNHVFSEMSIFPYIQLYREPILLAVGCNHRFAHRKYVGLEELKNENIYLGKSFSPDENHMVDASSKPIGQALIGACKELGFTPRLVSGFKSRLDGRLDEYSNYEYDISTKRELEVEISMHIVAAHDLVMPVMPKQELNYGCVEFIPIYPEPFSIHTVLYYDDSHMTPAKENFLSVARSMERSLKPSGYTPTVGGTWGI